MSENNPFNPFGPRENPNNNDPTRKPDNQPPKPAMPGGVRILLIVLIITFILNFFQAIRTSTAQREISYDQFLKLVDAGAVETVMMNDTQLEIALKANVTTGTVAGILGGAELLPEAVKSQRYQQDQYIIFYTGRINDGNLVSHLQEKNVTFSQVIPQKETIFTQILSWLLPMIIMYVVLSLVLRAASKRMGSGGFGGMGGIGKSKAKMYTVEQSTGVTFKDVAGQEEAKESLEEMVDFLKNPGKYTEIGAKQPKGALLVGPPGTGKTLLAKAVAGEAGVPYYHLSGSEFVEMFVGVGASRVRDLFQTAKKSKPCIIFIDEIDAIGKKRDNQMNSNDEREQTLNQLLAEMDGFEQNGGIIVLAATNRPEILDQALLRPGRFDRRIIVERPDLPGREGILQVHAKKVALAPDADLHAIALATSGASGADLANIINEAALRAVRMDRKTVTQADLQESVETVFAGKEKKDRVLNMKEREMVAYHEVGHALVSALQTHTQPVQKITIVPRTMGSLGYTMNVPEEERYLMTRDELLAKITTLLGGRAAEIVQFGTFTTGASNDIERATDLARKMVTQYGMSEKFGPMGLASTENKYLDGRNVSTVAESTGAEADEEVRKIIDKCQEDAIALLQGNRVALGVISDYLLQKENITGAEFMDLLNTATPEKEVSDAQ